jgi:hypothetical protein
VPTRSLRPSRQDFVIAVVPHNDRASCIVEGDAISLVDVCLPYARNALDSVGVKSGMPRIIPKQLNATCDRCTQTRFLLASDAFEVWRNLDRRHGAET